MIIFRILLFISLSLLIFFGWLSIFLGFSIIPISRISPFIDYKTGIFGFSIWALVLFLFSLEKRVFSEGGGIDIQGEYGSIKITRDAIEDVIGGIEIDGIDELSCKVSIRGKIVDLRVFASCFSPSIEGIGDAVNKEIDKAMSLLMIKDYRKVVVINHIKKRRGLK